MKTKMFLLSLLLGFGVALRVESVKADGPHGVLIPGVFRFDFYSDGTNATVSLTPKKVGGLYPLLTVVSASIESHGCAYHDQRGVIQDAPATATVAGEKVVLAFQPPLPPGVTGWCNIRALFQPE